MWVMGGRARELMGYDESLTVGGIIGPRVADIPDTQANKDIPFTTQRYYYNYMLERCGDDD